MNSRRVMALMLLTGLGMPQMGCVIPQEINVLSPDLPRRNSPPRILQTGLTPPQRVATVFGGSCSQRTRFQVQVEDLDTGDVLNSVWIVDGDSNRPLSTQPIRSTGARVRQVIMPTGLSGALSGLTDGQSHTVEVFVSDGEIPDESKPFETTKRLVNLPDGGQVEDSSYTDTNDWIVKVDACPP